MKKCLVTLSFLACMSMTSQSLLAQDYYVDHVFLGSRSKLELFFLFGQAVDYDVNLYRVRYLTPGTDNLPDTASGLIVIPVAPPGTDFPIVVYAHGTTSGPTDVPSQLRGGYEVAMAYSGKGFIAFAPDFLGLGESRGFHPYVHAATEASASRDMFFAGLEWLENNEPDWDPRYIFLTGYSQGGHVSAALHREFETHHPFYPITAATHMSGPYSISGVMRDLTLSDEAYGFPAYIGYVVLGYQEVYDNLYTDLHSIFKEPYVTSILQFRNNAINLTTLNNQLIDQLNNDGPVLAKRMLQDSILTNMETDSNYILNVVLRDNDVYEWAPLAPTRLYYCGGDQQVPYQNALVAEAEMQALGAPDVEAVSINATFDHGPCVFPSIQSSVAFFQSFIEPSGIADLSHRPAVVAIQPNPVSDVATVLWEAAINGMQYTIINVDGQLVREGRSPDNTIDVRALPSGVYAVACTAAHETRLALLVRL